VDDDEPIKGYFMSSLPEVVEEMLNFYQFEASVSGRIPSDPDTLQKLLGRTPIALTDFIKENIAQWQP
jgi:hypothetical protein